jgi:hypothetical protein
MPIPLPLPLPFIFLAGSKADRSAKLALASEELTPAIAVADVETIPDPDPGTAPGGTLLAALDTASENLEAKEENVDVKDWVLETILATLCDAAAAASDEIG